MKFTLKWCVWTPIALLICILIATVIILTIPPAGKTISEAETDTETVKTIYGTLRGQKIYTLYGERPYYSFRGIPYAKPPIGELRFKPPQRANGWNDTRDALEFGSACVQLYKEGDEDCLYLNVYTPDLSPHTKLPVLVSLHGGSFSSGFANFLTPDFLLNEANIILVTLNYRLGPLGFLSLGTPEYSGNMGLKDQLLAMEWVFDNIDSFGGDKYAITLHGQSSGSCSVHMHTISAGSKGLFQRVIMSSGVAINPWSYTYTDHRPIVKQFALTLDIETNTEDQLINFLKTVDAYKLIAGTAIRPVISNSGRKELYLIWVPVIEPAGTVNPFLERSPTEILQDNFETDIDALFSFQSDESYPFINNDLRDPTRLVEFNEIFEFQLPLTEMNKNFDYDNPKFREMAAKVRQHYFGTRPVDATTLYEYNQVVSDIAFAYGIETAVKMQANASSGNTFYFRFGVDAKFNFMKLMTIASKLGLPGATHGDDLFYLFGSSSPNHFYDISADDSLERKIISQMSQMYANFIIFGKPVTNVSSVKYLEPVRTTQINYLDITNDGMVPKTKTNEDSITFLTNLFTEYQLI